MKIWKHRIRWYAGAVGCAILGVMGVSLLLDPPPHVEVAYALLFTLNAFIIMAFCLGFYWQMCDKNTPPSNRAGPRMRRAFTTLLAKVRPHIDFARRYWLSCLGYGSLGGVLMYVFLFLANPTGPFPPLAAVADAGILAIVGLILLDAIMVASLVFFVMATVAIITAPSRNGNHSRNGDSPA